MNFGRQVAMAAGLPISVAGMTMDRQCGSGLMAITTAAKQIAYITGPSPLAGGLRPPATGGLAKGYWRKRNQ